MESNKVFFIENFDTNNFIFCLNSSEISFPIGNYELSGFKNNLIYDGSSFHIDYKNINEVRSSYKLIY